MHQTEETMKIASETRTTGLRPYKSDIGPTNIPITVSYTHLRAHET